MAQIHNQTHFGASLARESNNSLDRIISDRVRKIEEKHEYERNLHLLKGINFPNAEEAAYANKDQMTQLLKNHGANTQKSSFGDALNKYRTGGVNLPTAPNQMQQPVQSPVQYPVQSQEHGQDQDKVASVAQTPEAQQATLDYINSPEAQNDFSPEQIEKIRTNVQAAMQSSGQTAGVNQLMQGGQPQPVKQDFNAPSAQSNDDETYLELLSNARTPQELAIAKEVRDIKQGVQSPKAQAAIEKANKPFIDKISELKSNAEERKEILERQIKRVKAGKVSDGFYALLPDKFLSNVDSDDANYITDAAALANLRALEFRGPVGKAKLEAGEREKATIDKPNDSKLEILKNDLEKVNKSLAYDKVYKEIMAENNGIEPKNLSYLVGKRVDEEYNNQDKNTEDVAKKYGISQEQIDVMEDNGSLVDGNIRLVKRNGKLVEE